MEKSKNGLLLDDGLHNIQYKVLNTKDLPLYKWYLVKLPEPPKKEHKASVVNQACF